MTKPETYRRISKFELHELIGEGAMGVVWKAYDTVIRRYVALKLLPPRIGKTADARERFLREARAAGLLQHPNVVTLYDLGDADGQLYLAMELVEGRDLSELIATSEPLSLERKLDIVLELLDGLGYAHERGVIHRDIKPSNVRITGDGRVKIMDFGIARLQSGDAAGSSAIVGTPNYMAPEQVTNGRITPATDIFSVGCLVYELLSLHKPFEGETVHGVLYQVLTTEPKPLRTMAPSIPASLERVVARAMGKVPQERYQTAHQMHVALQGIRAALSGSGDTTERLTPQWTMLPAPLLRLFTYASLKWRIAAWSTLALVVLALWLAPHQGQVPAPAPGLPAALPPPPLTTRSPTAPAPAAGAPAALRSTQTLDELVAEPPPAGINPALAALRDSALAARHRALLRGAMKNNVPSAAVAEAMLALAEERLRAGERAEASSGYVGAVPQYRAAAREADRLAAQATLALERAVPVVEAVAMGGAATRAQSSLARAESLNTAQDYALAALAARDAEQAGVDAGIAPPSPQPADARRAIDVLLLDLQRALASERVGNLKLLFPTLTPSDAARWRSFFARATHLDARFQPERLEVHGDSGTGTIDADYRFVPSDGGAQREERSRLAMAFRKTRQGWRIGAVQAAKK